MKAITSFRGDYRFLSNFYPVDVEAFGLVARNAEAAFQGCKTLNIDERVRIFNLDAKDAKAAGRKVELRPEWENIKDAVMFEVLRGKFLVPKMRERLLETGDATLIEQNDWHDRYWGHCVCPRCVNQANQNKLGKLLMLIRQELQVNDLVAEAIAEMNSKPDLP